MFAKLFTGSFLAVGSLLLGAFAASDQRKDCCSLKLGCCNPESACCVADAKLGCCDNGLKCCTEDKECCAATQACCVEGLACCEEAKECCGPTSAVAEKNAATVGCCSVKPVANKAVKACHTEVKCCTESNE